MAETMLEMKLKPFLYDGVRCLKSGNWRAALALALTLPDICSGLSTPDQKGKSKYIAWVDEYLFERPYYRTMMTASDVYALRCSYLHAGIDDVSEQYASEALDKYKIVFPGDKLGMHLNKLGREVVIDVQKFSEDMFHSILDWIEKNRECPEINNRAERILSIENSNNGWGDFIQYK